MQNTKMTKISPVTKDTTQRRDETVTRDTTTTGERSSVWGKVIISEHKNENCQTSIKRLRAN